MDTYKTPLRYPGGKRVLYKVIAQILRENNLLDGFYVEPFAGGAGVAMELLLREYVQHIYLNDVDPHIFAFWQSILNNAEDFIRMIENVDVSVDEWKRQKHIYKDTNNYSSLEVGFSTFFLNRCNRSGILGGRPIGGLDQTGPWKIGARFNKKNLIARIEMIALYKERIHVYGCDATVFLKTEINNLRNDKTFIYLDPPYYIMGGQLYLNNYIHADHFALSQFIKNLPVKWVLSYDNVPQIKEMYKEKRNSFVNLYYRANERKVGKELIFFSDDINIPDYIMPLQTADSSGWHPIAGTK